jgi:hypothetical protein
MARDALIGTGFVAAIVWTAVSAQCNHDSVVAEQVAEDKRRVWQHHRRNLRSINFGKAHGLPELVPASARGEVTMAGSASQPAGGRRLAGEETWRQIRIKPIYVDLATGDDYMTSARAADVTKIQEEVGFAQCFAAVASTAAAGISVAVALSRATLCSICLAGDAMAAFMDGGPEIIALCCCLALQVLTRVENMLQVRVTSSPLYASRQCTSYWQTTPAKCASYTDASCGLASEKDGHSFGDYASYYADLQYYPSNPNVDPTTITGGAGLADFDFAIFVTAWGASSCSGNGGSTLAYAATCQRDEIDRPTWGRTNWCPKAFTWESDGGTAAEFERAVATGIHEVGTLAGTL